MTRRQSLSAMALAVAALSSPLAQAERFSDAIELRTQDQSLWYTGNAAAFTYDSGFIGGKWGTFDGQAPATAGLNAMTGSAHSLVPGTGIDVPNPLYPAQYLVWLACVYNCGAPPSTTIFIPPQYIDTRTGADLRANNSGKVGFSVNASLGAGTLGVNLPFQVQLNVPTQAAQWETFKISGNAVLGTQAAFDVRAPFLSAAINAHIHNTSQLSVTNCVLGACNTGAVAHRVDLDFQALGVDSRRAVPVQLAGQPQKTIYLNGTKGPLIVLPDHLVGDETLYTPSDRKGGVVRGNTVQLKRHDPIGEVNIDLPSLALAAVPESPPLSLSYNFAGSRIEAITLEQTIGLKAAFNHTLTFEAGVTARLEFDHTVEIFDSFTGERSYSRIVEFDLDDPYQSRMSYRFVDGVGKLLSRQYLIDDDSIVNNKVQVELEPQYSLKAGCFSFDVVGYPAYSKCAIERNGQFPDLPEITAYQGSYELRGFNSVTILSSVPEPSTYALWLAGLGVVAALARRRACTGG